MNTEGREEGRQDAKGGKEGNELKEGQGRKDTEERREGRKDEMKDKPTDEMKEERKDDK
jgi:hypothetical protein